MMFKFAQGTVCRLSVLLAGFSPVAFAVEPLIATPNDYQPNIVDDVLDIFGADADFDRSKTIDMSYIPTAYYTPEKQFGVGLLLVGLYKTDKATEQEQPSSLVVNTYASMNQSYGISAENMTYFNQGQQRLNLELELHNEAAVYYGIGSAAGDNENNKNDFDEVLVSFKPTWMTALADNYFVGIGAEVTHAKAENIESEAGPTSLTLPSSTSSGIRLLSSYDSRDYRLNASEGWLFEVDAALFHRSDNNEQYGRYGVELNNYIDLSPMPGLLAWQLQGQFSSGDVPWYALPDLGGSSAMRGYIRGRYRDKQMAMGQVEYRLPAFQRYGMVFWGAAGSVAPSIHELNQDVLASVGTGFRVRIKDRINLRADIGKGKHETHFYLNVNEAF